MNLDDVLARLARDDMQPDGLLSSPLELPWELSAREYLAFADVNRASGAGRQALVDALSNAKRALHCQVDSVLYALGLHGALGSSPFPKKLEVLGEIGVVTREALRRVNTSRNMMEHEYVVPTENEVGLFVDVVALFIEATSRYVARHEFEMDTGAGGVGVELRPSDGGMQITLYPSDEERAAGIELVRLSANPGSPPYIEILRRTLAVAWGVGP
jgi:hypothetical protein